MGHRVFAAMHGGIAGDVFVLACGPTGSYGLLSWLRCEHRRRGRFAAMLVFGLPFDCRRPLRAAAL